MGRGDKRTAKGKRFKGSYGKSRPHKDASIAPAIEAAKKAKAPKAAIAAADKPTVKKAPAKKAAAAPKKKTEE